MIGWADDKDVYLEPDTALAAAQKLARDQGESLAVSGWTLHSRLKEDAWLKTMDKDRVTIRRVLAGCERIVPHLDVSTLAALSPYKQPCGTYRSPAGEENSNKDTGNGRQETYRMDGLYGDEKEKFTEETQANSGEYASTVRSARSSTGEESTAGENCAHAPKTGESSVRSALYGCANDRTDDRTEQKEAGISFEDYES